MSRRWRKRRDPLDRTTYHVRRADAAARQVGGFMVLAASAVLVFLLAGGNPTAAQWRATAAGAACFALGAALFAFGEFLRRRERAWAAQGLLAIGGSVGLACAAILVAATFQAGWARALTCPAVLGLLFIWPVVWHAARALPDLRSRPTTWTTGFQPLVGRDAPLPVTPLPPEPEPEPETQPVHRSDSSR